MIKTGISYHLSQLTNPKVNKNSLIIEILSKYSYSELLTFKRRIPHIFMSLLKVPYLRRRNFADIFKVGKVLWAGTVDVYGAIAFIIQNNSEEINHYLELKKKLDYATATKQYITAYSLLEQIDNEVSVSMTGTYYLLKLTRLDKGITASTQLHNSICKQNSSLCYISNIALKSASIDMPFEAEIEHQFQSLRGDEEVKDFITAFAFPYKELKGDSWLRLLPYTSIIDLYEGFLLQLSQLTSSRLKEEHIRTIIADLALCLDDARIQRYDSLLNNGVNSYSSADYKEEMLLAEKYYSGDYAAVVEKGVEYLKTNPFQTTVLDLVSRSSVKLDCIHDDVFPDDSLAGRIYYFSIMASINDDISEICKTQLRNMCMAWYAIPGLRHLFILFDDIDKTRKGSVYQRFWNFSLFPEVRDACFFNNSSEAVAYLVNSGYIHDSSSQVAMLEGREEDIYNQTTRLMRDIEEGDYLALKEIIDNSEISPVVIGNVVSQLFDRLTEVGRFDEAVSLFVNFRLNNPHVKVYIDRQRITRVLTDSEDGQIKNQLELSAFYTMINSDIYKRYLAYKRYLKTALVNKASELQDVSNPLSQFFIGKVADRSVLMLHVRQFDTEDDVDTERIELCKRVFAISNEKSYSDEITSLIKEHEVRALAQQVNDSKIHVDVQSLVNNEFASEKLMFDTYQEIDENLIMFEQKNLTGFIDYLKKQYEGKNVYFRYELPTVKYKKVLFQQIVLSIRDKFLFDPRYGLDKYLSARIRHGTLITQLRNHFLSYSLVTNKKEGGEYIRISSWTQQRNASFSDQVKDSINGRLLSFTEWLDEQLREVKEEKIQIYTERNDSKKDGLFNYSEELMGDAIDALEEDSFESFDAFIHSAIGLLWKWTNGVLQKVRDYFQQYQEAVLQEMLVLQNDVVPLMGGVPFIANQFKDAITSCRTDFQTDVSVVTSWFKPEQSRVRFFTIQQAVDTSLSVINKINQNALSFSELSIIDTNIYNGVHFNAFHDIFHDMMNNILGYEAKRPELKSKGTINITNIDDILTIEVSNPLNAADVPDIEKVLQEQQNFPQLIAGGKTMREKNSGCVKIYCTVMYTLGGSSYENTIVNNRFVARIQINTKDLEYHEDSIS